MAIDFGERGRSGLKTFAGQIYDSTLLKLQGPERNTKLRAMSETDDVVSGILRTFEMLGRSVDWWIKPFDETAPQHRERAQFVSEALHDMSKSWRETLSDIYTFLDFGFAPLELVYKMRRGPHQKDSRFRSKFNDNLVGWRKWALRSQTSIQRWMFDEAGGVAGLRQQVTGDQLAKPPEPIPIEKLLLFRTTSRKDNPEGRAIGEGAYRTWFKKHHLEDVEAIAAENNLVGIPWIRGPEKITQFNPSDTGAQSEINSAMNVLTTVRHGEAEAIFIPFGWGDPQLISSPGRPTIDLDKIMRRADSRIAISMLAGFVLTGIDKHGSFALSSNQLDIIVIAVNAYNDAIAEVANRFAVPRLFEANGWPVEEVPSFEHGEPDFATIRDALDAIKTLGALGSEVVLLPGLVRQILGKVGLEVTDEEMKEVEEREPKQPPFPKNLETEPAEEPPIELPDDVDEPNA